MGLTVIGRSIPWGARPAPTTQEPGSPLAVANNAASASAANRTYGEICFTGSSSKCRDVFATVGRYTRARHWTLVLWARRTPPGRATSVHSTEAVLDQGPIY